LKDFKDPDTVAKAEQIMEGMETDIEQSKELAKALSKITTLARPSNELLGTATQYYPIMYFVDKNHLRTMQTCSGEVVNEPIVGESMDGCATACNDAVGSCVGFSYFGVGKTSLCFLLSNFKSAVYYTGCRVPGLLQQNMTRSKGGELQKYMARFHRDRRASSPGEIEAWPCTDVGVPMQVMNKHRQTYIYRLNIEDGRYGKVLQVHHEWGGKPHFRQINACAINPVDSILYCAMNIKKDEDYLVRIDTKALAFVAKLPGLQYAGTFDVAGNYFCSGPGGVWKIARAQSLPSSPTRTGALLDDSKASPFKGERGGIGWDIVSMKVNLDGNGDKTYVLGMHGHIAELVMNVESDPKQFKIVQLKASGLPEECNGWGSAWIFKTDIFYSCNEGSGVFQLDPGSIELEKKTVKFYKAGISEKTGSNDGMNCPNSRSPFKPVLPPRYEAQWLKNLKVKIVGGAGLVLHKDDEKDGKRKIHVEVVNKDMKVKKDDEKKKGDGHLSPGQVYCMAKFSEFNGMGLKPDSSGKCRHCLRDLSHADKCY